MHNINDSTYQKSNTLWNFFVKPIFQKNFISIIGNYELCEFSHYEYHLFSNQLLNCFPFTLLYICIEVKLEAIGKIMLTVKISTKNCCFFTINMQSQTHHMVYIRNAKCLLFITEGSTSPVSKDWLSFIFP